MGGRPPPRIDAQLRVRCIFFPHRGLRRCAGADGTFISRLAAKRVCCPAGRPLDWRGDGTYAGDQITYEEFGSTRAERRSGEKTAYPAFR
jgi:hypothetical protein